MTLEEISWQVVFGLAREEKLKETKRRPVSLPELLPPSLTALSALGHVTRVRVVCSHVSSVFSPPAQQDFCSCELSTF